MKRVRKNITAKDTATNIGVFSKVNQVRGKVEFMNTPNTVNINSH